MANNNEELWLQITSGQGPEECALAVRRVSETLSKTAVIQGINFEILDSVSSRKSGAYKSMLVSLSGLNVRDFLAPWIGTILWVCESPYRPKYARKNWYVGVAIFPATNLDQVDVDPRDISWKAVKAAGPGGQHVNKTNTAVLAIHRPSGITVTAAEERSQHANKKRAIEKIRAVISTRIESEKANQAQKQWREHNKLERGNPVKTFVGREFMEQ